MKCARFEKRQANDLRGIAGPSRRLRPPEKVNNFSRALHQCQNRPPAVGERRSGVKGREGEESPNGAKTVRTVERLIHRSDRWEKADPEVVELN
jgi:hypothetical protein